MLLRTISYFEVMSSYTGLVYSRQHARIFSSPLPLRTINARYLIIVFWFVRPFNEIVRIYVCFYGSAYTGKHLEETAICVYLLAYVQSQCRDAEIKARKVPTCGVVHACDTVAQGLALTGQPINTGGRERGYTDVDGMPWLRHTLPIKGRMWRDHQSHLQANGICTQIILY